jgi:hypothetical protein
LAARFSHGGKNQDLPLCRYWRDRHQTFLLLLKASTAQTRASCCSSEIHRNHQFFCFDHEGIEE